MAAAVTIRDKQFLKEIRMKILVIDDSPVNLASATATLGGHELITCDTYDKATELLEITYNSDLIAQKFVAAGLPKAVSEIDSGKDLARWNAWWQAKTKFAAESKNPYWDAVLVDLLMPAGNDKQGPKGQKFVGQVMPVGFALVLLAAKNGAKYGAVVTVTNHHDHPASAMLDQLESEWYHWKGDQCEIRRGAGFNINGCKVGFFHGGTHHIEDMTCWTCKGEKYQAGKVCSSCYGSGCKYCDGTMLEPCQDCSKTGLATGKDWGDILESLQK